jgi:hypothetical protein
MASVAHEGNPRVNSLAVSGTLDGVVYLLPQPGNLPQAPQENPTEPIPQPRVFGVPEKYVFDGFVFGNDTTSRTVMTQRTDSKDIDTSIFVAPAGTVLEYSRFEGAPLHGAIIRPFTTNWWALSDQTTFNTDSTSSGTGDLQANKDFWHMKDNYYGVRRTNGGSSSFGSFSIEQTVTATVVSGLSNVTGGPISGLALGVKPDSTSDAFWGIAGIMDFWSQVAYICAYQGHSLKTLGSILTSEQFDLSSWTVDDIVFYLTLNYEGLVNEAITGGLCVLPEPTTTSLWSYAFGYSFGEEVNVTNTQTPPPHWGPDMWMGLVNVASEATHFAAPTDSVKWKDVHGYYTLVSDNTKRTINNCA